MSDTVKLIIEEIEDQRKWLSEAGYNAYNTDIAFSSIRNSIGRQHRKGEWIDNGSATYTCSNCKTKWTTSQIEKMCFCPTCGADMRGDKNNC